MVRFRLLCGDFLLPNQQRTLKNERPSAWDTRPWPPSGRAGKRRRKGAGNPCRENGAPNINWPKWPVDLVNDTKRHSPEKPYVLRMTSTWHYVKPRWKVVNGQIVHLPSSHNREGLVGDHFDHQPDNRNALLCKSGCYHFDNSHASVTLLANNAFHYPPHTRNRQRRMPMTTEQWERENQDTLMEYFIDGDPSVRRIQCEYCHKVIYTQTRNRKYCNFQTCGHKMLNLRKSLKKRAERGTYTCACCGEPFLPIRADARYCSNACRQKDYRQRKIAAHTALWGTW